MSNCMKSEIKYSKIVCVLCILDSIYKPVLWHCVATRVQYTCLSPSSGICLKLFLSLNCLHVTKVVCFMYKARYNQFAFDCIPLCFFVLSEIFYVWNEIRDIITFNGFFWGLVGFCCVARTQNCERDEKVSLYTNKQKARVVRKTIT